MSGFLVGAAMWLFIIFALVGMASIPVWIAIYRSRQRSANKPVGPKPFDVDAGELGGLYSKEDRD